MKRNIKFFTIVVSLLLMSALMLAGCMLAIAEDHGGTKPYDLNGQRYNSEGTDNVLAEGDAPTAQGTMQGKFEAMYEISEDGTCMTAISEDYLNKYWRSNYEQEVIHSLSTEEVYYIIQDSIRIYFQYEKVVLPAFASISSDMEVSERFPFLKEQEIFRFETSFVDLDRVLSDIHRIILYRLAALSSPKAFFFAWEAILFVGNDPVAYNSHYPEQLFYIPGYSADTDREYVLSIMGGTTNFTDLERFPDLFKVYAYTTGVEFEYGSYGIDFISKAYGSTTRVYPPEDILALVYGNPEGSGTGEDPMPGDDPAGETKEDLCTPVFQLDPVTNTFVILSAEEKPDTGGTYVQEADTLILYADGGFRYVFCFQGDEAYEYVKGESEPVPGCEFEDGKLFYWKADCLVSDLT